MKYQQGGTQENPLMEEFKAFVMELIKAKKIKESDLKDKKKVQKLAELFKKYKSEQSQAKPFKYGGCLRCGGTVYKEGGNYIKTKKFKKSK